MRLLLFILACCLAGGCDAVYYRLSDRVTDVTGDRAYWGEWPPGRVLVTERDLFWVKEEDRPAMLVKVDEQVSVMGLSPGSVERYRAEPQSYPAIVAVIPAGTRVRICKLEHHTAINVDEVLVTGELEVEGHGNVRVRLDRVLGETENRVPEARAVK